MAYERTLIALVLASIFSLIYVRYDITLSKSDSLH
jgi:hypothetical protein